MDLILKCFLNVQCAYPDTDHVFEVVTSATSTTIFFFGFMVGYIELGKVTKFWVFGGHFYVPWADL